MFHIRLIDQIFKTVKWRESIIYISNKGVSNFIEIGPGKVLNGMIKRTLTNVKSFSINSIADIKNLVNEVIIIFCIIFGITFASNYYTTGMLFGPFNLMII